MGPGEPGMGPGATWRTGNLLFRATITGAQATDRLGQWAKASCPQGREYILWYSLHGEKTVLVAQPLDSLYCYEVFCVTPSV